MTYCHHPIILENPFFKWRNVVWGERGYQRYQENLGIGAIAPNQPRPNHFGIVYSRHCNQAPAWTSVRSRWRHPSFSKSICRHIFSQFEAYTSIRTSWKLIVAFKLWRKSIIHRSSLQWLIVMVNVNDQEVISHDQSGVFLKRLNVILELVCSYMHTFIYRLHMYAIPKR